MSKAESAGLFLDLSLGDADGIHWNSFIAAVMPQSILTEGRLQEAFDALDVDRVGYLTEASFKSVLADDVDALGDGLSTLFRGAERVDYRAFSEAFFEKGSGGGGGAGGGGGSAAAASGGSALSSRGRNSSLFILGSLPTPSRGSTASAGEAFPVGMRPAGAARAPQASTREAGSSASPRRR